MEGLPAPEAYAVFTKDEGGWWAFNRAFAGNPAGDILRDENVTDLDAIIGWDRKLKRFVPYSVDAELRRLRGYGR